jgi:hypothetical protein
MQQTTNLFHEMRKREEKVFGDPDVKKLLVGFQEEHMHSFLDCSRSIQPQRL